MTSTSSVSPTSCGQLRPLDGLDDTAVREMQTAVLDHCDTWATAWQSWTRSPAPIPPGCWRSARR